MTGDEALQAYQIHSYNLNSSLWTGESLEGSELLTLAEALDDAIAASPTTQGMRLFRGGIWRLGGDCQGGEVTLPAFTSTTTSHQQAKRFVTSDCQPGAILTINIPAGTPCVIMATHEGLDADEQEILLPREGSYRVERVRRVTSPAEIVALLGLNLQGVHMEGWDVELTFISAPRASSPLQGLEESET